MDKRSQQGRPEPKNPQPQQDDMYARLMRTKGQAGQKKLSTWQQAGHKRFNAHGCQ